MEELERVRFELAQSTKRIFQIEVVLNERLSLLDRVTK